MGQSFPKTVEKFRERTYTNITLKLIETLDEPSGIRNLNIGFLNRVHSGFSVVQRETTFTISDSTSEPVSTEYEIVKMVSHHTTEICEITRLKIRSSRVTIP